MNRALKSRYESEDTSPGFMLWRVTNRWQVLMRRTLKPFGLTHFQFVLLAALTHGAADGPVTQAELSHRVRADPMMVSQVLRALERNDLVSRLPDEADGRAVRVSATPAGRSIARAANLAVEAADTAFFGPAASARRTLVNHLHELDSPDRPG